MHALMLGSDLRAIEQAIQLAIAPAFLLSGIVATLSVVMQRLQRIIDLEKDIRDDPAVRIAEHTLLIRRARLTFLAIVGCVISALCLCILVILSFVQPILGIAIGFGIPAALILGMVALATALALFLWEVLLSAGSLPARRGG